MDVYKIKFEGNMVGRGRRIEPFDVNAADQDQLRYQILKQVKPKLLSREVDLAFSFDPDEGMIGSVLVGGYRPVGRFTVTLTEGSKE